MNWKLLAPGETRVFAVIFRSGDDVTDGLIAFGREQRLEASHFTAIGAFAEVTLGFWDWERREYQRIPIREQVEVLSLVGNVARGPDGAPLLHAHVVVGKSDGTAHGGHLLWARVRPTLEVVIEESPAHLRRVPDEATGLMLLAP
jgi:predicted DNA-binding protein with PD1-like motif